MLKLFFCAIHSPSLGEGYTYIKNVKGSQQNVLGSVFEDFPTFGEYKKLLLKDMSHDHPYLIDEVERPG